ncbi:hypothetical protein JW926_07765, partial [Candidatus Sumerlaeota bacterium]|nr:hypothetical protein [Candidatus Sumerlaeota bacterium]
ASEVVITAGSVTTVDFVMGAPPEIDIVTPSVAGERAFGKYAINWTDSDPDNAASISLYFDNDNTGADGALITEGISEDSVIDHYEWNTTSTSEGIYWIYGVIDDEVNPPVVSYSSGSVMVSEISKNNLRDHILGVAAIPPSRISYADFNGDGALDIADLIVLINHE